MAVYWFILISYMNTNQFQKTLIITTVFLPPKTSILPYLALKWYKIRMFPASLRWQHRYSSSPQTIPSFPVGTFPSIAISHRDSYLLNLPTTYSYRFVSSCAQSTSPATVYGRRSKQAVKRHRIFSRVSSSGRAPMILFIWRRGSTK